MAERIVITATGILTAIGYGQDACLHSLLSERPGLRYSGYLQSRHSNSYVLGEVPFSNDDLAGQLGLPPGDNGYTRTSLLAMLAMKDVLKTIDIDWLNRYKYAFINANTVGGMCAVENMYQDMISLQQEGYFLRYIDTLDCAESTDNVVKYFGLKPLSATISTACSSSANAVILGARMIKSGLITKAICGGCDALSRFTLNGFASLKNVSKEPCRPFDKDRAGLNLGEGAGYILLEKESDALERGAPILAVLSGYNNSNDAYHPTAPSPDGTGALRTMRAALQNAGLNAQDIRYINAHGTATEANDSAEAKAIAGLFDQEHTVFSSTKPYTGHTLAAAGIVEAIFSILGLQNNVAFANLNFEHPIINPGLQPVSKTTAIPHLNHVMSNSFGFGGNNVSLILSKA